MKSWLGLKFIKDSPQDFKYKGVQDSSPTHRPTHYPLIGYVQPTCVIVSHVFRMSQVYEPVTGWCLPVGSFAIPRDFLFETQDRFWPRSDATNFRPICPISIHVTKTHLPCIPSQASFAHREVHGCPKNPKIFGSVFTCILNTYPKYEILGLILHKENPNLLEFSPGVEEKLGSA